MRTVIDKAIESETQTASDWYFPVDDTEDTDFELYGELSDERQGQIAERYGVTPSFLEDLTTHLKAITNAIHRDLVDIWKRLD